MSDLTEGEDQRGWFAKTFNIIYGAQRHPKYKHLLSGVDPQSQWGDTHQSFVKSRSHDSYADYQRSVLKDKYALPIRYTRKPFPLTQSSTEEMKRQRSYSRGRGKSFKKSRTYGGYRRNFSRGMRQGSSSALVTGRRKFEFKYDDCQNTNVRADGLIKQGFSNLAYSTFYLLNGVRSGTSIYQRVGNQVNMRSIQLSGCVNPNFGRTNVQQTALHLRMLVVYDRQPTTTFPFITDIIGGYDENLTGMINAFSYPNPNGNDRFKVLIDKKWTIPMGGSIIPVNPPGEAQYWMSTGWNGSQTKFAINDYKKLPYGCTSKYRTNSDPITLADFTTGALYLITLSDEENTTNNTQYIYESELTCRIRWTDD